VVCQPTKDNWIEKLYPSIPGLVIALVALCFSASAFFYNRSKDDRARRQSIVDDFWLRKIFAPVSIEPLLEMTLTLDAKLPTVTTAAADIQAFWLEQAQRSTDLSNAFAVLGLIDDHLDTRVRQKFEEIDDAMANYCGFLEQHLDDTTRVEPDRRKAIQDVRNATFAIFEIIKQHQVNLGLPEPRWWRWHRFRR
jgi:hypothetical protein